ncbi:hypothetical protein [Treponema succinifaciens]|uniref:Uncharacterized protein n=1 Tax=Treponema succinifaciens (strain ATCC 33096 / DSM 2489 / 6091) TaxID=869209 RepID=F2NS35_TRES6|nr:hypothetical protein [Treponema succinifaciens]AEB14271.1 hypothetical protein Tresu_1364 [Treponema succinifaciens DSM 2489]MDY2616860.1 hypothetical protein [Treponema succinifaciens]
MTSNLKNQIDSKPEELKFIKTSELPLEGLSDQQKVALNRRANALLNEGKIEMAKRIFITTGYSDGLTRIGDNYNKENKYLDALKMYLLAHNKRKSEPIIEKISQTVSVMLKS